MSKVGKGPGLGAGWRRGDTAGLEDGIIESSGTLIRSLDVILRALRSR